MTTLRQVRELARKRPEQEFLLNRLYGAHVSPYLTVLCLRLGLSPDQVTIVGAAVGALGVALLFLPPGWWSAVAVGLLQLGYVLDFSDGQVARMTGRSSQAGSYLDWLTHFYIPVAMALAIAASLAWQSSTYAVLIIGAVASLELAAFGFSCKEHVLIAMLRRTPQIGQTAAFHAALRDDAHPDDVLTAAQELAGPELPSGISGRSGRRTLRSFIGELLIYPGAVHLVTVAVLVDLVLGLGPNALSARGLVLLCWSGLLIVHLPVVVRRNHRVIAAVEGRSRPPGDADAG